MERDTIINEARKWLGVRWKHQGRSKSGVDCAGLVIRVAYDLGISTYDTTGYSRSPTNINFLHKFNEAGAIPKPINDRTVADIAVFEQYGYPCHCGILTENGLIHAYLPRKKVVEEGIGKMKLIATFGFPGVT